MSFFGIQIGLLQIALQDFDPLVTHQFRKCEYICAVPEHREGKGSAKVMQDWLFNDNQQPYGRAPKVDLHLLLSQGQSGDGSPIEPSYYRIEFSGKTSSRYSLNFSSWRKPFAGADLVQIPWTGWKYDTFQTGKPFFLAAK
jgi:hypothetical protein